MSLRSTELSQQNYLLFGMGATGLSCLSYLESEGANTSAYDDSFNPLTIEKIKKISKTSKIFDGSADFEEVLQGVESLLVSPGVPLSHPLVQKAKTLSIEIIGDIELFCRINQTPLVAITGSNAKSTVVTLLGLMADYAGVKAGVFGNIGRPVMEALKDQFELIILELSSFQLDTTDSLRAKAAVILNISEDHLDRYESFEAYQFSKHKIYRNSEFSIFNRLDEKTLPNGDDKRLLSFGLDKASPGNFGLTDGYLTYGDEKVVACEDLPLKGKHQIENYLACLAVGYVLGFSFENMLEAFANFKGLAHRCELVLKQDGILWVNDSKGTNVGACTAALNSFGKDKNIILIAGGDSKEANLGELKYPINAFVKHLLLIGVDAPLFDEAFSADTESKICDDLEQAVLIAKEKAVDGDVVLLSPACASMDMFKNYIDRGDQFKGLVQNLVSGGLQ